MADDELLAIYEVLREEIDQLARAQVREDGSGKYQDPITLDPISRRLLVRSIYALIEASAYRLKQDALETAPAGSLTPADRAVCAEEAYELTSNGEARAKRAKLRTLSNIRFGFGVAIRAHGAEFTLDVSGPGWQALRGGLAVRDRLMHPKVVADLSVTDNEIRTVMEAFYWIQKQLLSLLESQNRALEWRVAQLREEHDQQRTRSRTGQTGGGSAAV